MQHTSSMDVLARCHACLLALQSLILFGSVMWSIAIFQLVHRHRLLCTSHFLPKTHQGTNTLGIIIFAMYKTGNYLVSTVPYIAATICFFIPNNGIVQLNKLLEAVNQFNQSPSPKLAHHPPSELVMHVKPHFFFSPTSCPSEIPIRSEPH